MSTGNLTDERVRDYIEQQEGEPVHDDSRFVIDSPTKLPPSRGNTLDLDLEIHIAEPAPDYSYLAWTW